jgi:hypothetical protein
MVNARFFRGLNPIRWAIRQQCEPWQADAVAQPRDQTMRSFLDAKMMAKSLREALAKRNVSLSHSDCLEVVAAQFGLANWNMLAAKIAAATADDIELARPQGWIVTGHTELTHYRLGLDPAFQGVALIESRFGRDSGVDLTGDKYAVLMQSIVADAYRGGKVRLIASLKTEDADAGTIWMRVDRAPGSVVRFDNMMARNGNGALKGTRGWTTRSIVLDVPDEATSIHFGFFLQGYGRVWAKGFSIQSVSAGVETTAGSTAYLPQPTNLDFSLMA